MIELDWQAENSQPLEFSSYTTTLDIPNQLQVISAMPHKVCNIIFPIIDAKPEAFVVHFGFYLY